VRGFRLQRAGVARGVALPTSAPSAWISTGAPSTRRSSPCG
jgi:hypothetical protein